MLMLELTSGKRIIAADQSTKDILKKGMFGSEESGHLCLTLEEALYLIDVRNAKCTENGKELHFNNIVERLGDGRLITRYLTYRDWRDRGLMIKEPSFWQERGGKTPIKRYPSSKLKLDEKIKGTFFPQDLITIIESKKEGKELYDKHWFGQYGTYKASDKGILNKLDVYEALFLLNKGALKVENASKGEIVSTATKRRPDFQKMYDVYADWREKGYVVKTGFKFGTHFRIYFPGAKPMQNGGASEWTHSKHVIHVFPRDVKLLISEWARAIRVAHSVRKTFILAIPGKSREKNRSIDFVLYHRKGGNIEVPGIDTPRYAMLSLSEDEYIGGSDLSAIINEAKSHGLELVIAIVDRETAVTYYKVRRIELPRSDYEYYEIDWMQP